MASLIFHRIYVLGLLFLVTLFLGCGTDHRSVDGADEVVNTSNGQSQPDTITDQFDGEETEGDTIPQSCEAVNNVQQVAEGVTESLMAQLTGQGYERINVPSGDKVNVSSTQLQQLKQNRTTAPLYFDSEVELLALPEDDPLLQDWLKGDITAPDWETQGLLVTLSLSPYTETFFFKDDNELLVFDLRLEGCLSTGELPEPPPCEYAQRRARRVPRFTTVLHRTQTEHYRIQSFPVDSHWERYSANPLINRAGAGAAVVQSLDVFHMWVNGYSGATGFIFHGSSSDGFNWDFSWDTPYMCVYESFPDIQFHKRDPTVLFDDGQFVTWVQVSNNGIQRLISVDGLVWEEPKRIQIEGTETNLEAPFVNQDEEGSFHLWGHASNGKGIIHATSVDGLEWTAAQIVLEPGASIDDIDHFGLYHPFVLRQNDRWVMFYTACYSPRVAYNSWHQPCWYQMHIAVATSDDGWTWEKSANPVLSQIRDPGHWESGNIGRPIVLRQSNDLWLYYTGVEGGEPSTGLIIGHDWTL